eukprot:TRINITY_DN57935_c0_g1_i1.p2 TRINITY_DN57935_c0_g1~~TRINITY_DN57935_c0_g1_i1.p2  ORF type:complete len:128 (+),score=9.46 TRINITY_DN57935_c0_g1_i1:211-594(+)
MLHGRQRPIASVGAARANVISSSLSANTLAPASAFELSFLGPGRFLQPSGCSAPPARRVTAKTLLAMAQASVDGGDFRGSSCVVVIFELRDSAHRCANCAMLGLGIAAEFPQPGTASRIRLYGGAAR